MLQNISSNVAIGSAAGSTKQHYNTIAKTIVTEYYRNPRNCWGELEEARYVCVRAHARVCLDD